MLTENQIIKAPQTESKFWDYRNIVIDPVGIVVHSTAANNPNLKRYVENEEECGKNPYLNWFGGPNSDPKRPVIPHGCIGLDIKGELRVAQILPYDRACQCAGTGSKGSYNYYGDKGYIQFEICEDNLSSEEYMRGCADLAAQYCAYLMALYPKIDITNVISHKEASARGYASAHVDPDYWWERYGYTMDDFRDDVLRIINDNKPVETDVIYRVQVGAFKVYSNAVALRDQLQELGYQAFICKG